MGLFLAIFLSIWGAMHAYVFWRLASIDCLSAHVPPVVLGIAGFVLWLSYLTARILDQKGLQSLIWPIEYFAANWVGLLFLLFAVFLLTDVVTLGGWLIPDRASAMRGWAAIAACVLAGLGMVQAMRPPVVTDYEVELAGLPAERDGMVLVQLSDLHLGNLLGRKWLSHLIERVLVMKADIVVIAGDLVDANVGRVEPLPEALGKLRAPLGVWAVTGNHEHYAGVGRAVRLLEGAGFRVLRDAHQEVVPGLVMAGVDDLGARGEGKGGNGEIEKALADRPKGGAILLSHSPVQAEKAAEMGAGLMLCGHTHNGQVWPFTYLVRARYRLLSGRYQVKGMTVIVSRGAGTWGPRMRLWKASEIVRVKLRASSLEP